MKSVGSPWWLSIVTRGPKLAAGGSLLSLELESDGGPGGSILTVEVNNGPGWLHTVTRGQVVAASGSAL